MEGSRFDGEQDVINAIVSEVNDLVRQGKLKGNLVDVDIVTRVIDNYTSNIKLFAQDKNTIAFGQIGKFYVKPGRLEAVALKRKYLEQGMTTSEAGIAVRAELREKRKIRINRTHNVRLEYEGDIGI